MTLAWHSLFDYHDCDPQGLADVAGLRRTLLAAIEEAGGTYVTDVFHEFSPHGLSAIVVIAESHVALHTWPEHRFAALDVFSCTQRLDQQRIATRLGEALLSEARKVARHERGVI